MLVVLFVVGMFYFPAVTTTEVSAQQAAQDFTRVNKTGVEIHALYVTPHNAREWGDDVLGEGKLRILVGTDVTDNYVMILGAEDAKFAANEQIIDEIRVGFEMWSGGASGGN